MVAGPRWLMGQDVVMSSPRLTGGRGSALVLVFGCEAIQDAAPMHAEHVRRLFIDALTSNQLNTFARLSHRVLDHMEKQPD